MVPVATPVNSADASGVSKVDGPPKEDPIVVPKEHGTDEDPKFNSDPECPIDDTKEFWPFTCV